MKGFRGVIALMALQMGAMVGPLAGAQTPGGFTPGQVEDTLPRPELRPAPPPSALPEPVEPPASAPVTPPGAEAPRVTVREFQFVGNTVLSDAELKGLLAPYLGQALTLEELYEATDLVARAYRRRGYTLASVNLPPQRITGGEVRLEIIEGRVHQLRVEGRTAYPDARLARYLEGSGEGELYRGPVVNEALLRLNELPGLSARAVVRPGPVFGTSDLILNVQEQRLQGQLALDNFGREPTGEARLSGLLLVNNPGGVGDQIQLFGLISEDALLRFGQLGYHWPVNRQGTRMQAVLGYSEFEIRGPLKPQGDAFNARLGISHPTHISLTERLELTAALTYGSAEGRVLDVVTSGTDITLLELGGGYSLRHAGDALTRLGASVSTNFRRFTAEDIANSQGKDDKQIMRVAFDASHQRPVAYGVVGELRVQGVFSPDPLVDGQQFAVGGPGSVRGYPAAEIRGDGGYAASLTFSRPFRVGALLCAPRVFGDYGEVYREAAQLRGTTPRDSLASVGLGADLRYGPALLRADVSFPTDSHVVAPGSDGRISNGRTNRLLTSLSMSF